MKSYSTKKTAVLLFFLIKEKDENIYRVLVFLVFFYVKFCFLINIVNGFHLLFEM